MEKHNKPGRERLDMLVMRRGLAPSRERARALIMAGKVLVEGHMVDKAGTLVPLDATCELTEPAAELRFVSRGGLKLERALDAFALDPTGLVGLDVGASTGGFTDVLLRRGAARIYAVDVGHGQLAWSLRNDPRVVVMERTNIRHLTSLPEPAACAVADVSFISLRLVLPPVSRLLAPGAWLVALVKPQFEAGRAAANRGGGVISDPAVHRQVLHDLLDWLARWPERARAGVPAGEVEPPLVPRGLVGSPIVGRDGNHEYLLWLSATVGDDEAATAPPIGPEQIARVVDEVFTAPSV